MAELLLKIGDAANKSPESYKDGDVLCAMNQCRIRYVAAQHICKPHEFTRDGLRASGSVCEKLLFHTYQYKFERISRTEINRIDLSTMQVETFGPIPNERGEKINVPAYLQHALKNPRHRIFGTSGAEVWYGGRTTCNNVTLNKVWADIEMMTPEREINHQKWNWAPREHQIFLALIVEDFDNAVREELVSPEITRESPDADPVVVKKRSRRVNWEMLNDMTSGRASRVKNRDDVSDIRDEVAPLQLSADIEIKANL